MLCSLLINAQYIQRINVLKKVLSVPQIFSHCNCLSRVQVSDSGMSELQQDLLPDSSDQAFSQMLFDLKSCAKTVKSKTPRKGQVLYRRTLKKKKLICQFFVTIYAYLCKRLIKYRMSKFLVVDFNRKFGHDSLLL